MQHTTCIINLFFFFFLNQYNQTAMESVGTDSLVVSALTNSATVSGDQCSIIGIRAFANHIPLSPPHTNHYTVLCNRHKKATQIIYI